MNSPGEGAGQAEHDDGEDDVHEVEAGEGLHQLVENLLDFLYIVVIRKNKLRISLIIFIQLCIYNLNPDLKK